MKLLSKLWHDMCWEFNESPKMIATAIFVFSITALGLFAIVAGIAYIITYSMLTQPMFALIVGLIALVWTVIYLIVRHKINKANSRSDDD